MGGQLKRMKGGQQGLTSSTECANCGAEVRWDEEAESVACTYCGTEVPRWKVGAGRRGGGGRGLLIGIIIGVIAVLALGCLVATLLFVRACE
jgi:hypothetical protein